MPKTNDLVRRLRRAGFILVRHGKKHDIFEHEVSGKRIVVWRHARDIPTGTYLSILRDAGLGEDGD